MKNLQHRLGSVVCASLVALLVGGCSAETTESMSGSAAFSELSQFASDFIRSVIAAFLL